MRFAVSSANFPMPNPPDPLDPLFERWADQASLDAHLAAMRTAPPPPAGGVAPTSATVTVYDVSGARPLS